MMWSNSNIRTDKSIDFSYSTLISSLIQEMRPKQWTKNLLVFAALIFSINNIDIQGVMHSIVSFILFCFTSSSVYILNDIVDKDKDKLHPVKKNRPIAAGMISVSHAAIAGILILLTTLICAFLLNKLFFVVLLVYFVVNVAYSLKLKHLVILDVLIIAIGFVLRAIGGGVVINVTFTPWFLLCILLLALFLAISKRRHEYIILDDNKSHRNVLNSYSLELLNQLNSIVTTLTIMSYSLFTFTSGHTIHLMWTIPLVIYGVFRYLYLIHIEGMGGQPDKVLLQDKHILITVIIYALLVITLLLVFE